MVVKSTNNLLENEVLYVGLDVHRKSWTYSVVKNGMLLQTKPIEGKVEVLLQTLKNQYAAAKFKFAYEAGFSGFWLQRKLVELGHECIVVNAADVATNQKEALYKTDAVDAKKIAYNLSINRLEAVYIPTEIEEGFRDLCRYRESLVKKQTRVKNQIKGLLYKYGIDADETIDSAKWSANYIKALSLIEMPCILSQRTLERYIEELTFYRESIASTLKEIRLHIKEKEELSKAFKSLTSLPGIGSLTAISMISELHNMERFKNESHLASYVGFIPMLRSSGEKSAVRGLTFRQKKHLRFMLIEAAWIAVRKDPALMEVFLEQCKRKKKNRAIIKIAKKLLFRARAVWVNETEYAIGVVG